MSRVEETTAWGRGCRDRHDDIGLVTGELAGDLGCRRRIALRRFEHEFQILAFLVAGGRQRIENALARRIQRRMFDDRRHGDGDIIGLCGQGKGQSGGKS